MSRRLIPCAVLIAVAFGCGKKKDEDEGGGSSGGSGEKYTIKLREDEPGDRYEETRSGRSKTTIKGTANGEKVDKDESEVEDYVYVETIQERPDPDKKPTKLTREYTKAEITKDGRKRTLPYAGKTVLIEKGPSGYTFTLKGGQRLAGEDAERLQQEFEKEKSTRDDAMLPKGPVKLNETFELDKKAIAEDFGEKLPLDADKTSGTGKLTKVYKKDGKQFGVLEMHMDIVLLDGRGKVSMEVTLDGCIDGSSHEGKMTIRGGGTMNLQGPGGSLKMTIDGNEEKTIRPVK